MKKFLITGWLLVAAALPLVAHEMNETNPRGLFGFTPEYIHVLINPLPTYGLIVGIFVLFSGLLIRSVATRNVGMVIVFICAGITWVVIHYGQHAYNHIYQDLDAESQKWANIHMDRAESFGWVFYVTAVLSLIALCVPKFSTQTTNRQTAATTTTTPETKTQATAPNQPTTAATPHPHPTSRRTRSTIGTASAAIVLLCAIISFALGSWISRAGGRIRHPEFRETAAQVPAGSQTNAQPPEHHHH